jgi:integrase
MIANSQWLDDFPLKIAPRMTIRSFMDREPWWVVRDDLPLGEVIGLCVEAKTVANRRPVYVKELRRSLRKFSQGRETIGIASISPSDIEAYFKDSKFSIRTRETQMSRLGALFSWAERRGLIQFNPVRRLDRIVIDHPPPRILTPEEADRLLMFAENRQPKLFGYIVLGLFAGVRPDELAKLEWSAVDIERALLAVDSAASKTRMRRVVPLHPKAVQWIRRVKNRAGPVVSCNRPHQLQRLAMWMGWEEWPKDVLRKTCASYLLALHQDAGKVSMWMGHTQTVLYRHYRELVRPEDCAAFWSIA